MSVTLGLPFSVWFLSGFCLIPDLYAKFPAFYANIFLPSFTVLVTYVVGSL